MFGGWGVRYNDNHYMEFLRTTKVIKTGTSLCVVIPKPILKALGIERGDQIAFGVYADNTIMLRKLSPEDLSMIKPDPIVDIMKNYYNGKNK